MSKQLEKFISLLEEMFQFDQADLDFGIYRIMNQKREEIQSFLKNDLVPQVNESFEKFKGYEVDVIKQQLEQLEKQLSDMGVAKESSEKYQSLSAKLSQSVDTITLENEVYSHLTNFFKRYYSEGDFISQRRYKKDVYAIPYEGEEVKLHWANADQYYVKSSEQFKDYTFSFNDGKIVNFKLTDATTEQNNNKEKEDKERRFILFEENPIILKDNELTIQFEYKIPAIQKKQGIINKEIIDKLSLAISEEKWKSRLFAVEASEKDKNRTVIEKHLNTYTAKNTFDYFIHKDLEGFLKRELDFFIKNEIMHLDDLNTENEIEIDNYLSKIKVFKSIGYKIIGFLAQLENFQKKLWLKKKFVVATNYCITLDRIPEYLYPEILNNQKQIDEWIKLYKINQIQDDLLQNGFSEPLTVDFLKQNPYLVIDTIHFDTNFKNRVLSNFDDIDTELNGLLVHGDNFQGLNLIQKKYNKKIQGIYIDPPYNTNGSEIVYKNGYKDSSWATLMYDRLSIAKKLLTPSAPMCVTIDEYAVDLLGYVIKQSMSNYKIRPVIIEYNHRGRVKKNFAITHEYGLWVIPNNEDVITKKRENSEDIKRNLRRTGTDSMRTDSPKQFYGIEVNKETLEIVGVTDSLDVNEPIPQHNNPSTKMIWPIDDDGIERRWYYGVNRIMDDVKEGTIWAKKIKGKIQIHYFQAGKPKARKSIWSGSLMDSSTYGSELLNDIFGSGNVNFSFPKSIHAVQESLEAMSLFKEAIFMDFFGGSGTTGHAVINLNRNDQGNRKYILMEMGSYFDTTTKVRIKKIIYSPKWDNGTPLEKGTSHCFKYIRLESYEDTLNNIELRQTEQQKLAINEYMSTNAKEEYMLSYMLENESQGSSSLLSIDAFNNPFDFKMKISNGNEIKIESIDLVETFNYLLGLHVKTIDFIQGCQLVKGYLSDGDKILIIWRNIEEVSNEELNKLLKKLDINSRDFEYNRIYVNGDNHIENLKVDESNWKVRLIEEEFKTLMFDVNDI
ncbi:DNA methyltransferase [Solibacillus sp. FSL R7-0682]|uniref:DNA methyltransferase n=1 Tax=Solibacillus sp. FSL R7-0682 TaxID=2921690 RepID=UPI0030F8A598